MGQVFKNESGLNRYCFCFIFSHCLSVRLSFGSIRLSVCSRGIFNGHWLGGNDSENKCLWFIIKN